MHPAGRTAQRMEIGAHRKRRGRWMYYARFKGEVQRDRTALEGEKASSIYCACFGAKVVEGSDHTSEGKRQISSPRFLRRKRTEIGSYRN